MDIGEMQSPEPTTDRIAAVFAGGQVQGKRFLSDSAGGTKSWDY
jgi:hypothetical protein